MASAREYDPENASLMTIIMHPAVFVALSKLSSPLVCDIIEELMPERRDAGYTTEALPALNPMPGAFVGLARTAKISTRRPSTRKGEEYRHFGDQYFDYLSRGSKPGIIVVEDVDGAAVGMGSCFGMVTTHMYRALGYVGAITNGSARDTADYPSDFPVLSQGGRRPSHGFMNIVEFETRVSVAGMAVAHDDLLLADQYGAVVIPVTLVDEIILRAAATEATESRVLQICKGDDFTVDRLRDSLRAAGQSFQSSEPSEE